MGLKKGCGFILAVMLPLLIVACGGGSSSSSNSNQSATALVVAEQVSVVDPKLSNITAAPAFKSVTPLAIAVSVPADSAFFQDETHVYVQERSVEMFGMINEILCSIAQTRYEEMLNLGPYTAQVDLNQCSSTKGDASQSGQESSNQSSGATAPDYELWTVVSSRANDSSPQTVSVWVHQEANEYEPAQVISAKLTITEGKSASNPYGIFMVNFVAHLASDPSILTFKGILKSERDPADASKILLKFVDGTPAGAPHARTEAVTLNKNADGTSGSGSGYRMETWDDNSVHEFAFDIAFNTDFFLRSMPASTFLPVCLDRNSFAMSAWSYGLYDAVTGARVNRNSGFPIKVGNAYGNVGYWGLWLPDTVTVNNGDTIYKHDYQTNTDTPYTVFKAQGKLKKHTKHNFLLGDVKNIPLDYNEFSGGTGTNFRVVWTGTNFSKVAFMPQNCTDNCMWTDIADPKPTIDFSALQWSDLNFWSQALGGQVRVPLAGCTFNTGAGTTSCSAPTDATTIIFYQEDIVYPTDTTPASLNCYDNCPAAASAAGIDPANVTYYPTWDPGTGQSTVHSYTFSSASMLLMDGSNPMIMASTSANYQWGINTGALIDPSTPNLTTLLDCNWDNDGNPATNPQTCGWKAWSALDVFYTWETGPNNWNQFTAIKDASNAFVVFEPPLQVEYVHSQTDPTAYDYKYNGAKFFLEYSGFGQLHGIPATCVNMDTGEQVSCSAGSSGSSVRWVPEFVIESGAPVQAGAYIVKPLEMEQRMRKSDTGCTGLNTTTYTLPDISEWTDPAIGAEPVVADAPAVIGGVLQ